MINYKFVGNDKDGYHIFDCAIDIYKDYDPNNDYGMCIGSASNLVECKEFAKHHYENKYKILSHDYSYHFDKISNTHLVYSRLKENKE